MLATCDQWSLKVSYVEGLSNVAGNCWDYVAPGIFKDMPARGSLLKHAGCVNRWQTVAALILLPVCV